MFGGEVTGHYYFRDNFYADNGFIPALLILELMSKKGQTLQSSSRRCARSTSSRARSTPRCAMDAGAAEAGGDRGDEYKRRAQYTLDGISVEYPRLAFQRPRPPTPSRCCA